MLKTWLHAYLARHSNEVFCPMSQYHHSSSKCTTMSGFLPLEDLEPTLSDVLAFIDTFDSDTTASTASSSSSDNGNSPRPSPSPQSAVERRKTRKAAASRRCQQKKRAELLALRAQVTALESRLKELSTEKRTGSVGTRLDRNQRLSVTQLWRDKALLEQQLRRQSEERNRQLMAVVARQSSVAQTVRNVLNGVTNVVNIEEALRTPPPTNTPSVLEGFVPNLHDAIYGELSANLSRMYVDVNTRFTSLGTIMIQDVSTGVHVMTDAVTGVPFVELKTATTTSLSLKDTEKVVMCLKACHYNRYRKYLTELGVKKETEYELRDEEMALALSCLSLSRSYEEENRRMLTFSTLVCDHPTESELRFREEGFVVATRSPINPLAGTVIQSCYRLTPEISSGQVSGVAIKDATKMFVLQNLGNRIWSNLQQIQANCVEAQLNPAAIPATC
ncbi:hypothetical protein PC110_g16662 [Phytophthora cactorum]|uniref:BZIP domain-containing protein n=1 Tax=Phytophthora cactorum TaxID=29920 RepID=A0A329RRT9_9STRA|nr:hypothetical protein PC115_g9340 [Phytophthora cactorum]RAW26939.1 hypothetical protein PC110_g16662 [Phytophthora cactorum]